MSTETHSQSQDSGLDALVTLLHLQGVAADRERIRHRLATDKIGAPEILRCAKTLGLKARARAFADAPANELPLLTQPHA